jgi:hypothetical protein
MRYSYGGFIASAALLFVIAGCGASAPPRQGSTRVEPASSKGGYDFHKEGQIPAPAGGSAKPETDVEEIALEDSSLEVSEAEAPPDTAPKVTAPADSTTDGFRIQLFASADRDVAQNARDVAAKRLGIAAHLDLDGGVYKVRVGDYRRREDAAAALPTVRAQYYPDAWIVSARINVPRVR